MADSMVIGMVKSLKTHITHLSMLAIVVVCAFGTAAAFAQAIPLSKECQTSNGITHPERALPATLKGLRERKIIKILTIGIAANAATEHGGYQDIIEGVLEKAAPGIDVSVIDRGVSGELARDAVKRMKAEVALAEPDLVLWQVGSNDALARIPVNDFTRSLTNGVRWLKGHNIDVVLVGLHYVRQLRKDKHYQAIRSAVARVADNEKVLLIGRYEAMEMIEHMRQGGKLPDEFAQTEEGYSCMAEYVARAIASSILIKKR